jgi:hypothetical protein
MQPIRIKVMKDGRYFRTVCPRDDAGTFQAEANENPLARRASDMTVEALGLNDDGVNDWLARHMPGETRVAETRAEALALGRRVARRIGSNDGRKPPVIDMVTISGAGVNLKLCSSEHDEVLMTTQGFDKADICVKQMSGAPVWALQVKAHKVDDTYIIDLSRLEWVFIPAAKIINAVGGDLVSLLALARGGGRPKTGSIKPPAWAAEYRGNSGRNLYARIKVRGLKYSDPGWSRGTIHDLKAALAALV